MSKKQKIDPDYFLALTLQRKFNEEYKKEKDVKKNGNQDLESMPSSSSHVFPVSPVRKKPLGSAILIDPLPFNSHHKPPVTLSKPSLTNSKSVPTLPKSSSNPKSGPSLPKSSSNPTSLLPTLPKSSSTPVKSWSQSGYSQNPSPSRPLSLNDSQWEVIDPTPDVHGLFVAFGKRFFQDRLGSVEVKWSKRMTTCAGVCRFKGRRDRFGRGIGEVAISLSEPLLKLRPRSDLVNTLLHEMIHAYLFLFTENPNRADRDDHGQEFQHHMQRINREAGTKITIYHSFHDEVKLYKTHWWQCNGPCKGRPPFFGLVKRATNRAPGKSDFWFANHQAECGGQFIKIKEPENFKARGPRKNKENMITGSAGRPNIGGRISNGSPSKGSSTSGGNTVGFGGGNPSTKHVPTPGQPKIIGFVDLNKQGGNDKSPGKNTFGSNSKNTSGPNSGDFTLGTNSKTTTSFGGGTLGTGSHTGGHVLGASNSSASNSSRTLGSGNGLGTPGNSRNSTPNRGPTTDRNRFPGSSSEAGPSGQRPGSKLLDKLKFDSKNSNNGSSFGSNRNSNSTRGNVNNSHTNVNRGNGGNSRGFGGGMTGTRMNTGSGTVVLNPKKGGTMTSPNETTERITKPINKTEKPTASTEKSKTIPGANENRLNIDHFKPFMGQGQTLGGNTGTADTTRSRLLANIGARNISNSVGSRNNYNDSRNERNSLGKNDRNSRNDDGNGSRNKKPCLGNRSLYGETSQGLNNSSNSKFKSYDSNSKGNSSCKKPSTSKSSTPSKLNLSWELSDDIMDGDYEFEKVNSRFTQPNNERRNDNVIIDLDEIDDESFEHDRKTNKVETNKDMKKNCKNITRVPETLNVVKVNLDDGFEEMENMMNDSDIDVFGNISDEILSGSIGNDGGSSSSGLRNANNASTFRNNDNNASTSKYNANNAPTSSRYNDNNATTSRYNDSRDDNNHAKPHNDSLDDIFEMSSEEENENNGYDDEENNDESGGDDETHCPVCNKPIARASMGDHLENCMELSQVFDNVVIEEDDEEEDEFENNDSKVTNRNKTVVNGKQNGRNNDVVENRNETSKDDKSEFENRSQGSNGKNKSANRERFDENDGKTSDKKHDNSGHRYNESESSQRNRNETSQTRHDKHQAKNRERHANDTGSSNGERDGTDATGPRNEANDAGPSPIKVKCPICNNDIFESTANEHIDECLVRNIASDFE